MTNLSFIHLTDLHILPSETEYLHGQPTIERVRNIVDRIRTMELNPDFFLISGDLVNNGTAEEYQMFNALLEQIQGFDRPVLLGLGNHDKRLPFRQEILNEDESDETRRYYHSTMIKGLNVIMLDTVVPQETGGNLDDAQLSWLAQELAREAPMGHLIAMHHPPVYSTVTWLNTIGLENGSELAEVIQGKKVLGVLNGHIHYAHAAYFAGTVSFTTPATAYMIDPSTPENVRATDGSGFAIGTIHQGQLFMNPILMRPGENEMMYREVNESESK